MSFFRPRHLNRYRKIAEVMARHGFGAIVAEMGLGGALNLPRRLLRRDPAPETRRTAAVHLREALEELGPLGVVGQDALVQRVRVAHHDVAAGAHGLAGGDS